MRFDTHRPFAALLLLQVTCSGWAQQAPDIEWQTSAGGPGIDQARSGIRTSFGEYVFVGGAQFNGGDVSGLHGGYDLWLTKFGPSGNLVWQKALGGSGDDMGNQVIEATDGGFVCVGSTTSDDLDVSGNHGEFDAWVVKTNGAGVIEWQKCFGGSESETASDIIGTADGGFLVVGEASSADGDVSSNLGSYDFWVVRLNAMGELLWERSYGGSSGDFANTVCQNPDGSWLVAGTTASSDMDVTGYHGGGTDIWAILLNASGDLLWQKTLGGSGFDMGLCTMSDQTGTYVAGWTSSDDGDVTSAFGSDDAWIVSLSQQGDILWQASFGGSGNESARGLGRNADGGVILACRTNSTDGQVSTPHGGYDAWVLKVDEVGALVWETSIGGSNYDDAVGLLVLPDDGYLVTAHSSSDDGDLTENNGNADFWAVKLTAEPIGLVETPAPKSVELFPNPAGNELWIRTSTEVRLEQAEVFDTSGRLCRSFATPLRTALDVSGLMPGTYYCRLHTASGRLLALPFEKK